MVKMLPLSEVQPVSVVPHLNQAASQAVVMLDSVVLHLVVLDSVPQLVVLDSVVLMNHPHHHSNQAHSVVLVVLDLVLLDSMLLALLSAQLTPTKMAQLIVQNLADSSNKVYKKINVNKVNNFQQTFNAQAISNLRLFFIICSYLFSFFD